KFAMPASRGPGSCRAVKLKRISAIPIGNPPDASIAQMIRDRLTLSSGTQATRVQTAVQVIDPATRVNICVLLGNHHCKLATEPRATALLRMRTSLPIMQIGRRTSRLISGNSRSHGGPNPQSTWFEWCLQLTSPLVKHSNCDLKMPCRYRDAEAGARRY